MKMSASLEFFVLDILTMLCQMPDANNAVTWGTFVTVSIPHAVRGGNQPFWLTNSSPALTFCDASYHPGVAQQATNDRPSISVGDARQVEKLCFATSKDKGMP